MGAPRYKAALIGCGKRSRMHVRSYEHVADAAMTACCDLLEERRNGHARGFRLHVDLTRCRAALESGRLGAVKFSRPR